MRIQLKKALLWAVCTRCLTAGWEEQAVSSSGGILRSREPVTPFPACFTEIRELPQLSYGGVLPSLGKGNCHLPGLRGDFFSSEAQHSLISHFLQSLPCSSSFSLPPSAQLPPGKFPQVLLQRWWDRGGEKQKPPVRVAREAATVPKEPRPGRRFSGRPGSTPSSAQLSALLLLTSVYAGDHQQPHCSSSSAPRTEATETSRAFPGSSGMAHRLLADIMCPGDLQQHGLLFCRVKWHQQVKSFLQPNTGSFLPTSAHNTGLPMSHQHKPQLLTATSYSCSLTLCFNPSAPHHAEVLPKIPARKAKHNL